MKIEKLRNNHKKEIIIGTVLLVVIGGALTFRLTHSKYRVTQSIDLGSGVINYKLYDFKIMAMYQQKDGSACTESSCYDEIADRMPSSGYVINESKSYCTLDNVNHDNEVKLYTNENGEHIFNNLKKNDKCYLYFDKQKLGAEQILANITVKEGTPIFSSTVKTNEGVYQTTDEMYGNGPTYYWRGKVENNYVIFAEKCWRIVRINGDNTIRLIYNGIPSGIAPNQTCPGNGINIDAVIMGSIDAEKYYATSDGKYNNPSYVGWTYQLSSQRPSSITSETASNAKIQTENWYNDASKGNLRAYENKIANGKFCGDRDVGQPPSSSWGWGSTYTTSWNTNTGNSNRFAYAGAKRLYESYSPTFNCPKGDIYTLKVGAITADEVAFAGGTKEKNDQYYMYTGQNYWTMSPSSWEGSSAVMLFVDSNGSLNWNSVDSAYGLRPVINLKADTTFSSGNGTQNQPYVVS